VDGVIDLVAHRPRQRSQLVGRQAATVQDAVSIFYATTLALRDEQLLLPWLRSQL
jgi:hypothetical protein